MPKLPHSLNRQVIVSIPAFFGDDSPRRCYLVDIEAAGLWLSGESLNDRLREYEVAALPVDTLASLFFPFNQIVYLFDPAQSAYVARDLRARAAPTGPAESPKQSARGGRADEPLSNQKSPKPKR